MKITKLGHCCMLIEVEGKKILTDPGAWSDFKQNEITDLDLILITHEHADHIHVDSLKIVMQNNPQAKLITNSSVGKIVTAQKIDFLKIEHGENNSFDGIKIEGYGEWHKQIYKQVGMVNNTGYFIADTMFYPGDAFTNPQKKVPVLALPVAGPWMQIKEAIDYALELKPQMAFPVHDGMLRFNGPFHKLPELLLTPDGINWISNESDTSRILTCSFDQ